MSVMCKQKSLLFMGGCGKATRMQGAEEVRGAAEEESYNGV